MFVILYNNTTLAWQIITKTTIIIKKNRTTVATIRVAVSNSNRQTFGTQPTNIYTAHIHAGCFNSSWNIPSDTNKQSGSHGFTSNCNQQQTPNASNSNHLAFHIPTQCKLVLEQIGRHLKTSQPTIPHTITPFYSKQQPTNKPSNSSSKRLCLRQEYCDIASSMPKKVNQLLPNFDKKVFFSANFAKNV